MPGRRATQVNPQPRKRQPHAIRRGERTVNAPVAGKRGPRAAGWAGGAGTAKGYVREPVYASVAEAPEDLVTRAVQSKLPWVQRFVDGGCPRGKLLEYARAYARGVGIPEADIPPYTTLNTWVHQYRAYGLRGLIDAVRGDAGTSRTVTGGAADALEAALLGGQIGYTTIQDTIESAVPAQHAAPKYGAVRRAAARYERDNAPLVMLARYGLSYFRQHYESALSLGVLPGGYHLAIDSTVLNLWVRVLVSLAPERWVPMRPVLTVVEDVGSRYFATFNLALHAIDSGICLGTLRRALVPGANWPGFLTIQRPRVISFDQGSEHRGQFGRAVKAMGIDVIKRMPNAPKGGAPVERLIQTIETEVLTDMPGYSPRQEPIDPYALKESEGSRRLSQLKYEPYRMEIPVSALCTLGDVAARIAGWGASYNARPHVGLALEPFQVRRLVDEAHRDAAGDRVRGEMPWPHMPSVIPDPDGDADNSPEQEEDAA
jgi:hypothetical protein